MALQGLNSEPDWTLTVYGHIGQFRTPSGTVEFVSTSAELGALGPDGKSRLVQELAPAREILPVEDMRFEELLQRDLDDHRVSAEMIQYLVQGTGSVAFFPPILVTLLPFAGAEATLWPALATVDTDDNWSERRASDFLRIRTYKSEHNLAAVSWNKERVKAVIMDGQHRAMAALAIQRTITQSWTDKGKTFEPFYVDRVEHLLKDLSPAEKQALLSNLRLPVTLTWFPDYFGHDQSPLPIARRLFVDVNRQARTPSRTRLILLSDLELQDVFASALLGAVRDLREADGVVPLYVAEYDTPSSNLDTSQKWSALTNLYKLRCVVNALTYGDPIPREDHMNKSNSQLAGKLRENLAVESILDPSINDNGVTYIRAEVSNRNFAPAWKPVLENQFLLSRGHLFIKVWSNLTFVKAHTQALKTLKGEWDLTIAESRLAYEAIFNGSGVYYTLMEAHRASTPGMDPKISIAWQQLESKRVEFARDRAKRLLATDSTLDETTVRRVDRLFDDAVCTIAWQAGLALALADFASLATRHGSIHEHCTLISGAINSWFQKELPENTDRLFALLREDGADKGWKLNHLQKLEPKAATVFKFFWLQILASEEAEEFLPFVKTNELADLARRALPAYRTAWVNQVKRQKRAEDPDLTEAEAKALAEKEFIQTIPVMLSNLFGSRAAVGTENDASEVGPDEPQPSDENDED